METVIEAAMSAPFNATSSRIFAAMPRRFMAAA
jgi:hypothetical protein